MGVCLRVRRPVSCRNLDYSGLRCGRGMMPRFRTLRPLLYLYTSAYQYIDRLAQQSAHLRSLPVKHLIIEAAMSFFTAYLDEIKDRKTQGLSPKPIEDSELALDTTRHVDACKLAE